MIDHIKLHVADVGRSKAFYEAALAPLGFGVVLEFGERVAFGPTARPIFFLAAREPTAGIHIAFQAPDRERVDALLAARPGAAGAGNQSESWTR